MVYCESSIIAVFLTIFFITTIFLGVSMLMFKGKIVPILCCYGVGWVECLIVYKILFSLWSGLCPVV